MLTGCAMPDEKLFQLCRKISQEGDPTTLNALIDELTELLSEEQQQIKANISARSKGAAGA
jgi:ABC-type transporter Mla subunit MlaD